MKLSRVDLDEVPWRELDALPDRAIYQTRQWIEFVADAQNAQPLTAKLTSNGKTVGHFAGLTFKRMGIPILGSPFPGWTTGYMGFTFLTDVPKSEALECLLRFAFDELGCWHVEFMDRLFEEKDGAELGLIKGDYISYVTDLTQSEEVLYRNMTDSCRWSIRKSERYGVRIEEANDEAFADEYYEQLKEVFAKQNLLPTYTSDRVKKLIQHIPRSQLLLLRARDSSGACIATALYPGMNQMAHMWGNASVRAELHQRPNEALHWYAMLYWKKRGVRLFDWGGGGTYKEKYGVAPFNLPWFRKSRFGVFELLRNSAETWSRIRLRRSLRERAPRSEVGATRVQSD